MAGDRRVNGTERLSPNQIRAPINMTGTGAIAIDWDIDYSCGRGDLDGEGHCHRLWCRDGRSIDVSISRFGIVCSQSKEPDPDYEMYKNTYEEP